MLLILSGCSRLQPIAQEATTTATPAATASTSTWATPSGYHAFFLDNGLLVYGKAQGLGTKFVTLTDVHYIRNEQDPVTKVMTPRIYKRGAEFHRPEGMVINWDKVILVESVGLDSDVMKVIRADAQAKK
jgi:hypothetical protein